jgi:hypothetical protein
MAEQFGCPCPDDLTFETQLSNEVGARPDVIGKTPDGTTRLLIEVKFWAGLTPAQPVEYLKYSLSPSGGILLFVAPEKRLHTLWSELVRRVGLTQQRTTTARPNRFYLSVGRNVLALTSWRFLLETLIRQVDQAGDLKCLADLQQLAGLCDQMDADAFLPLTSEEMTSTLGTRVLQFCDIAIDLIEKIISDRYGERGNYKAVGWRGGYGRFVRLKGYFAVIAFSAPYWSKWGESPLWLGVAGENGKPSTTVREALTRAAIDFHEEGDFCYISIRLTTGVEREKVVEDAMTQIIHVADILPLANTAIKSDPKASNLTQAPSGESVTEILDAGTDAPLSV